MGKCINSDGDKFFGKFFEAIRLFCRKAMLQNKVFSFNVSEAMKRSL